MVQEKRRERGKYASSKVESQLREPFIAPPCSKFSHRKLHLSGCTPDRLLTFEATESLVCLE